MTSNESTSKYTQSRESSVERVLEDKRTRSRSYEPKSGQIQLKIQRDQMEQDDGELTLDDLETKFSIDDIDVNPIVNPSEVNNLSISLNSKRQIGLNLKYSGYEKTLGSADVPHKADTIVRIFQLPGFRALFRHFVWVGYYIVISVIKIKPLKEYHEKPQ